MQKSANERHGLITGWEDPLEEDADLQYHLPGESHGQKAWRPDPMGLQSVSVGDSSAHYTHI